MPCLPLGERLGGGASLLHEVPDLAPRVAEASVRAETPGVGQGEVGTENDIRLVEVIRTLGGLRAVEAVALVGAVAEGLVCRPAAPAETVVGDDLVALT